MEINYKLACQIIAVVYQTYSVIGVSFFLCSFASPNFASLITMTFLPEHSTTLGRLMFSVAQICFFSTYLANATILHLAINWKNPELVWPFFIWSLVHIVWELILIGTNIAFYENLFTLLLIFWEIFNIVGTIVAIFVIWKSYSVPEENFSLRAQPEIRLE